MTLNVLTEVSCPYIAPAVTDPYIASTDFCVCVCVCVGGGGGGEGGNLTPHHQATGLYVSLNTASSTLPFELISQLYVYMKPILQAKGKKGRGSSEVDDRQA